MTPASYDVIIARTFPDLGQAWDDLVALCRIVPPGQRAPSIHVESELDFSSVSWPDVVDALAASPMRAPLIVIADTHSLGSSPPTVLICATAPDHKAFRCEALHVSRLVAEIAAKPGTYAAHARQFDARGHYTGPPIASLTPPGEQARPKWWRWSLSSRLGRERGGVAGWPAGPLVDHFALVELEGALRKPREEHPVVLQLDPHAWRTAEAIVRREYAVTSAGEALMEVCSSFHNLLLDPRHDSTEDLAALEFGLTPSDLEELETEVDSQELDSISQYARLMIGHFVARRGQI